jgi:peptidoglycan-associated lipoprotein
MTRIQGRSLTAIACTLGLGIGACCHQKAKVAKTEAAEPVVRNEVIMTVPELSAAHFDFDSDTLKPEELAVLRKNADWLKTHPGVNAQVSGNCDQRGTVAYNLALGQRRAATVRKYYMMLGVPADRIATISFGKEKPSCDVEHEACWSENRRAETQEAMPQIVSGVFTSWHEMAQLQARVMIEKYGPPQEVSATELHWRHAAPYESIEVRNEPRSPLEQVVGYTVPKSKVAQLKRFGHGLSVSPNRQALVARNDSETLNLLTLNLAHSIATGKMTADEADRRFDKTLRLSLSGKSSPEMERLLFRSHGK